MIVLIAPENDVTNEIEILHQLFQEGLEYYHFRKPHRNYQEHCDYLNQIDERYHNRIVVHYFHELVNGFNIKGIHFQEQKRRDHLDVPSNYFTELKMYGKTISSSFHEPEELENCVFEFDYHLLSPVFSSISKQGYNGRGFDVNHINKTIIGMGGVTTENLAEFNKLGYKGVGVLGGIWNSKNPVENFAKMQAFFNEQ
ncbi:Regulatory protein TenI [Mariniflexile rhizosphaerae]|uniref:thiamine phosphate synthase n=1 Tax=unclassified Mariniflexile TaxID=2643887 RepID=UPI000CC72D86|nr:thiamine phosphate synthase [Mariniflexile sp. TRM1-10]AXP80639.1 Regulatory protein TenI [Mariniflexile sp. TRM1-10]PLB20184.1 MAG: Thiamine phosphate pyrophosphorylase [Flavobacteriaceae bacterium FS1-H7996/R]